MGLPISITVTAKFQKFRVEGKFTMLRTLRITSTKGSVLHIVPHSYVKIFYTYLGISNQYLIFGKRMILEMKRSIKLLWSGDE